MKIRPLSLIIFALACGFAAGSANAQDTTGYTYLVHGAPGRDLGPTYNPALPLDVSFNGTCVAKNWTFGEVKGPYSLPAAIYDVKVSQANSATPCSNAPLLEAPVGVFAGQTSFAVAGVTPSHTFTGFVLQADLSPVPAGNSRIFVANFSTVDSISAGFGAAASLDPLAIGNSQTVTVPAGTYDGAIFATGSSTPLYGPVSETLAAQSVDVFFVVGSASSGSLQIISKSIADVF